MPTKNWSPKKNYYHYLFISVWFFAAQMCTSKSKVHAESVYRLFLKQDINQQEAFFASFGAQQIRTSAPSTSTHADKKSHMEAIWRIISSSPFRQRIHFSARPAKNCLAHTHTYTPSKQREINSQSATALRLIKCVARRLIKRRVHFRLFPAHCPPSRGIYSPIVSILMKWSDARY